MVNYHLIEAGSYGKIYRTKEDSELVAIKKIPLDVHPRVFEHESFIGFHTIHLKYTVHVHRTYIRKNFGYIVMELCKTDLHKICLKNETFTERQAALIFFKIVKAVEELHNEGIAHCDLKLENILVTKDNNLKLCDFGSAVKLSHKKQKLPPPVKVGTPLYVAPEFALSDKVSPIRADLWSLGVLLHVLLVKCFPVTEFSSFITPSIFTLQFSQHLSKHCRSLLKGLLKFNPKERLSIKEVLNHKWIKTHTASFRSCQQISY